MVTLHAAAFYFAHTRNKKTVEEKMRAGLDPNATQGCCGGTDDLEQPNPHLILSQPASPPTMTTHLHAEEQIKQKHAATDRMLEQPLRQPATRPSATGYHTPMNQPLLSGGQHEDDTCYCKVAACAVCLVALVIAGVLVVGCTQIVGGYAWCS